MLVKTKNGFTLIELMVTLSVVAILAIVAIPSFTGSIKRNRAVTQTNDLISALNLARNEAIRRNVRVSVCSSTDELTCAASTDWATGWIVFVDQNNNGSFEDDADTSLCESGTDSLPSEDCLLKTYPLLKGNPVMTGGANFIQFQGSGAVTTAVVFTHKPEKCIGNEKHTININAAGRTYSTEEAC